MAELRRRRDRLAVAAQERAAERRRAEDARSRAEAAIAIDESRIESLARESTALAGALEQAVADGARAAADAAAIAEREHVARAALDAVLVAGGGEREELTRAERAAAAHRVRLRELDDRVRAAEVADLEARLARESMREQVLVELASLGPAGLRALASVADGAGGARTADTGPTGAAGAGGTAALDGTAGAGGTPGIEGPAGAILADDTEEDPAIALEAALDEAVRHWDREPAPTDVPAAARLSALRRRFHDLGAGNPLAVEEYGEVRARLDGLEAQREDLERAIRSTRDLIAELDRLIADQFRSTFVALEDAFGRRFTQLFGGGVARLSLTDPDDLDVTGVEIMAQPPGKKRQPLAMLSGGERALTAVALLFAMLEVRPVPFCVLDEVDAALDEANVGRFTDALRDLSLRTQCVVITHNRGTIEAADALYGVTIGDDAVSRVISLRLEEARTIVEAATAV